MFLPITGIVKGRLRKECLKGHGNAPLHEAYLDFLVIQMCHETDKIMMQAAQHKALMISKGLRLSCTEQPLVTYSLCGLIANDVSKPMPRRNWNIQVLSWYSIHLVFDRFDIIYSRECNINSFHLLSITGACDHHEVYCGNLPPWRKIYPHSKLELYLVLEYLELRAEFKISYFMAKTQQISLKIDSHSHYWHHHTDIDWTVNRKHEVPQVLSFFLSATRRELISIGHIHIDLGVHSSNSGNVENM